ncbi:MAG: CRISPR-associated protein Cas4 [Thermoanaerobacterales bacterium]|nr:CRISPR-associated protein Cas4 [Thermoanaerobacterales bacterium]
MTLKVGDIKQYLYCPRIIYYTYVAPVDRKVTPKMVYGKEEHIEFERLERRRTLRAYRLAEGERRFRTPLESPRLGLRGVLDMHVVTSLGCLPVEVKYTASRPGLNHKYQLVAYAMLLEDAYGKPVRHGYLYLIPSKNVYVVEITPNARAFVRRMLLQIADLIRRETFPPATRRAGRCVDCEYRRFCGDVV